MDTFTVIVDDRDPSIKYSGNWHNGRGAEDFMVTTSEPQGASSFATFSFAGTGVGIYGTINGVDETAEFRFVLDGVPQDPFICFSGHPHTRHQPFFSSPTLEDGPHEIVINRAGGTGLSLDYFLYFFFLTTTLLHHSVTSTQLS